MARQVDRGRFEWVAAKLAELAPDAAIVAEGIQRFQVRPRAMRTCVAAVRQELAHAVTADVESRRAQIVACYEDIYRRALNAPGTHLRVALQALDGLCRLCGLDAPTRLEVLDGFDPRGTVTGADAIRRRLAELEGREAAQEAPESPQAPAKDDGGRLN